MNRRTVLRSAGVAATVSLSGCVEALQEHYQGSFRGVVPVEIYSEADRYYNLRLEAYAAGTDRQTYEESYKITSGQQATAPHLEASEQHFRATKLGQESDTLAVKEGTITPNTELVVVRLTDDDLILDIERGDGDGARATAGPDSNGPEPSGTEPNGTAPNDTASSDAD